MEKKTIMLGMVFGSLIGGYIPSLWGADTFSFSSIICSAVGALLGIYLVAKFFYG